MLPEARVSCMAYHSSSLHVWRDVDTATAPMKPVAIHDAMPAPAPTVMEAVLPLLCVKHIPHAPLPSTHALTVMLPRHLKCFATRFARDHLPACHSMKAGARL